MPDQSTPAECPHAETQAIINETRILLKKGLLKARILSSTWSLMIVLMVQSSMSVPIELLLGIFSFYILWVGEAVWEMKKL